MDKINHPHHYCHGRKYEPIEVIDDWELGFNLGNALKYISRAGRKGDGVEDLKKAAFYIDREIGRNESPFTSSYEEVIEALASEASEWDFLSGQDDVVYYNSAEAGAVSEASEKDWTEFWGSDDDYMWDPSLGPVELSDKEIQDILDRKDLAQFEDDEIVSTIDKRGFIIGVKADGTTCVLKEGTNRCEQ